MTRKLAAPFLLLLLTLGVYWKLTFSRDYTWLNGQDLANQWLPWFQFAATEVHQGRIPLWDPNHWGGQSLIGQVQPGVTYPLNWLVWMAPLRDGRIQPWVLDAYFVSSRFLAALFAYLLCRDLKRSRAASLLAAIFFGLGSFLATTSFPNFTNGILWVPLVFLFLMRAGRGERPWSSAAAAGAACGWIFLTGHHLIPSITLLAAAGAWGYVIIRDRKAVRLAAVFLLFTLAVGAVQILPAYEYGRRAIRWVGAPEAITWGQKVPYSVHEQFSLSIDSLLGIFVHGRFTHANPFLGFTVAALALIGVVAGRKDWQVRLLAGLAVGGLLFALGGHTPFHRMLYSGVPFLHMVREPALGIFIFHFGITGLIAYGVDALSIKALIPCAAALMLFELGGPVLVERSTTKLDEHADIVRFLKSQPGPFRVQVDDQEIPYNFGDWHGIEDMGGYFPTLPLNVWKMGGMAKREPLYGVRYKVAKEGSQEVVFASSSGLKVYRDPAAFPRVWTVHRMVSQAPDTLVDPVVDLHTTAFMPGAVPKMEQCPAPDEVRILERNPSRIVIEARMACAGMVILSENHAPGWRATVDGTKARIFPANFSMRGVLVPGGRHRIEMNYRPGLVYAGAALTLLGLLAAAALALRDARLNSTLAKP